MNWNNFGSYWWIDKIIPRSVFKYGNVANNELKKCWSLKNLRPLFKTECKRKGDKVIWELIEKYNLFDILPIGLIPMRGLDTGIINLELESIVYNFVDKLENKKEFDKNLYFDIMKVSSSKHKVAIMHDMIEKIKTYVDYDETEVNFNFKPYLELLMGR
jgi:hypothetical protein